MSWGGGLGFVRQTEKCVERDLIERIWAPFMNHSVQTAATGPACGLGLDSIESTVTKRYGSFNFL